MGPLFLMTGMLVAFVFVPASKARAERCAEPVGHVIAVDTLIELAVGSVWQTLEPGEPLCIGDILRAGDADRAVVVLENDTAIELARGTTARITEASPQGRTTLKLLSGIIRLLARRPTTLEVGTRFANAAVEGTEFTVELEFDHARVSVLNGRVRLSNEHGAVSVNRGGSAVAFAGRAPEIDLRIRPRDAVQWAIHYEPIGGTRLPPDPPAAVREAARLAAAGERARALAALETVPGVERDAAYETLRAELLLGMGRPDEALAAVGGALARSPDHPDALALRSIIAVARNDKDQALVDARRAVDVAPQDARARIALSYAAQAAFDIPLARASLDAAVAADPDNALAWARLAEVQLMQGDVRGASRSAARAAEIDPDDPKVQTVQGFVALGFADTAGARKHFESSLRRRSFESTARLGLGLADIRDGDVATGQRQIELAVALDPNTALLRSYLGEAYMAGRRDDLAGAEFEIGKELDIYDPAPWFFDAIRKQLANRPVEGLRSLDEAIALNNNRAVYRSRLLLAQDRASRGAALARIYNDLGFTRAGVIQAARSLAVDPANPAAHRFLADLYLQQPRTEVARVSALLQSQLLDPLSSTPLQPSLAISDLDRIVAGTWLGFGYDDYSSLFGSDGVRATATGLVGSNTTLGDEISASLQHRNAVLALSQLHAETDGFRANNDTESNVYDAFAQWAVMPELSLQTEYRYRRTTRGDIQLRFDPYSHNDTRNKVDQQTARFGLRAEPAPGHVVIASTIATDRDEITEGPADESSPFDVVGDGGSNGGQIEAQYLRTGNWLNLRVGGGYYRFDTELNLDLVGLSESTRTTPETQGTAYTYADIAPWDPLILTLGAQYDAYDQQRFSKDKLSPKVGFQFQPTPPISFRGAYYGGIKRLLAANQTIEPVQIAGFEQLRDDPTASEVDGYALGVDVRPTDNLFFGATWTRRDLHVPIFTEEIDKAPFVIRDQREEEIGLYAYWALSTRWTMAIEPRYNRFKLGDPRDIALPDSVDTWIAPVTLRLFHPNGLFAATGASLIYQDVRASPGVEADNPEGDRTSFLLDLQIGYRLPGRRGLLSFEIDNILDKKLWYRDENYLAFEQQRLGLAPERTAFARVTLNF